MLRVIQIGYGYWGANICRNIMQSKKLELLALCEQDEVRAHQAQKVLPESLPVVADYKNLLMDDRVDAVVIATQTEYSFEIAMDAMAAGKHVFIEKPVATTVERVLRLQDAAIAGGLILHCDHIMVYNPVIRYIKKLLDSGELGDMLYFDVSRLNLGPIRKDVNAMLDLAVHDLAVIDYLSGRKVPIKLSAVGETPFGEQETLTYLTLQYDGFIAHIKSSWVSPLKERRTMIAGTKKMVIFDDMKSTEKLTIYDCGIDVKQGEEYGEYEFLSRTGDIFIPNIPFEDSLKNSLEHFEHCVETGRPSLSGPEQSIRVLRILESALADMKQ